jgi:class 3 adenylate cyclase/tetratricopeptide (TPR) repeat protein
VTLIGGQPFRQTIGNATMDLAASPERSIVTVLAVDTVDSTGHIAGIDPDDAQELLDRVFRHLSTAIERAGGLIVSYAGDGGCAVFGWPNSQEDHADRACDAAWQIQGGASEGILLRNLDGRPVQFRVGIHSGLVGMRRMTIGDDTRLDTVGGTVHLAAALQKSAPPGGIIVSSKTLELCQTDPELTPYDLPALRRLNVRGYRLVARPTRRRHNDARLKYRHPIVGRGAERETLRNILTRSKEENRAIAIIGEPGIGKSRLTATAIDDANVSNIAVLVFYGDSQRSTTPYAAMRSLIFAKLSLGDTASDDEVIAALKSVSMNEEASRTVETVFLTKHSEADVRTSTLTLTQVAREIILAFKKLTNGQPVLIVVEDLHLLDPESIHCLRLLSKEEDSAFRTLIVTSRPETMLDARVMADTVLRLSPLPRSEMKELALHLISKGTHPPQSVLETILDRADGIPFVLEQILLSIEADDAKNVDLLPQSVQSVIHARLNRLSPRAKLFAQALSVLGDQVEIDFALTTLDLDREALRRDRDDLERLEILDSGTGNSLRFHHAIVSEACLATVPGNRRQELHRAAIAAIKSIHSDLESRYERLAFHAEGAHDDEQALEYLWLAAQRARRRSASGSLYLMFGRAMRCIDRIGATAESRFVDLVLMAFDPLQQIGHFRELNAHLPRVIQLAHKQNRRDKVCAALCHMSMVSWFEGRYPESLEQSEQALAIANDIKSLPLIFSAKFMLASALHGMANMVRAIDLQRELCSMLTGKLETARLGAAGIPGSIVRSFLCWFLMEVGCYEEGLTHVERALEIAQKESEPYSEMLARLGMGRNLIKLKRDREAVECLEIAIALIERNGYNAGLPHIIGLLATAQARSGAAEHAVKMVEAWLESSQEDRTGRLELYYLNAGYSEALFRLDKIEQSLTVIDSALRIGRSIENPCLIVQGLGLRARIRHETGCGGSEAERDLAEQRELCQQYGLVAES